MRWLCLLVICLTWVACVASDPAVTGWPCVDTSECGTAFDYVCHLGQCQRRCSVDSDCQPSQACTKISTYNVCAARDAEDVSQDAEPKISPDGKPEGTPDASNDGGPDTLPEPQEPTGETSTESLSETPTDNTGGCQPGAEQSCNPPAQSPPPQGLCAEGIQRCQSDGSWGACTNQQPTPELCDGKDNDCDGQIDEDFPTLGNVCNLGVGECQAKGKLTCDSEGASVQCDANTAPPRLETCDGKDNDCDGQVDEDFSLLGKNCVSTGQGECQNQGKYVCDANGASASCNAKAGSPKTEECNGKDDDCDGQVDNVQGKNTPLSQDCYTGPTSTKNVGLCRGGKQTCVAGKWSACTGDITPVQEDCNKNGDEDCDGQIDEGCCTGGNCCTNGAMRLCGQSVGVCKKGNQICQNNTWGACTNEIKPSAEICDGKDNDCDGQTDNGFNVGTPCTVGVGECQRSGQMVCQSTSKSACSVQAAAPTSEQCDGKDNDCDGQTDEGNPGGNKSCNTGLSGDCAQGQTLCNAGKIECKPNAQGNIERCRNNKDDDCDGQVDEICGPLYPYIHVTVTSGFPRVANHNDGSSAIRHFRQVTRNNQSGYTLESSTLDCDKTPLFLSPTSHYQRSMAYRCSRDDYVVHISARLSNPGTSTTYSSNSGPFFAIAPNQSHDHWALVRSNACTVSGCTPSIKQGTLTITRTMTGIYRIASTRCSTTTSPLFTTIYANQPSGWTTAESLGNNICEVRTFDGNSQLTNNLDFAVWLPDPTKVAWALVTPGTSSGSQATINASNTFGDPNATWSGRQATFTTGPCPNQQPPCDRTEVVYPGWRNFSAILLQPPPEGSNKIMVSASGIYHNNDQDLYISTFAGTSPNVKPRPFYILMVQ